MSSDRRCVIVVGAGPGLGAAIGARFAAGGFHAVLTCRNPAKLNESIAAIEAAGGTAEARSVDTTDEAAIESLFDEVESTLGPVDVAVFNAGGFSRSPIAEVEAADYRSNWEVGAFGGFLTGRAAARRMQGRGRGTILFTGATASLKGSANFAAFAGSKHALRALAQSMARELGSKGIHVAHIILDGLINGPRAKELMGDYLESLGENGALEPAAIAEAYWQIHSQPPSTWTWELDLRPFKESW